MGQIHPTSPQVDAPLVRIAEEQAHLGYRPVTAALVRHAAYPSAPSAPDGANTILLAFRPDEHQRRAIAEGADIYVSLLTFLTNPMPGIIVFAGKEQAAAAFDVRPTSGAPSPYPPRVGPVDPPIPPTPRPVG